MGHIEITQETWAHQKHLAEKSLQSTGHLPQDGQPGDRFWDMVRYHYVTCIATTGNDHRFLKNHCKFVDYWVPREFLPKPAPSPIPALPPLIYIPVPPIPYNPPCIVLPAPPPIPPGSTQPPVTEHPGQPGNAVPEPAGLMLAGIGLVICWIGGNLFHKQRKNHP